MQVCSPVEATIPRARWGEGNDVNLTFGREPLGLPTVDNLYIFHCIPCNSIEESVHVITNDRRVYLPFVSSIWALDVSYSHTWMRRSMTRQL